MIATVILLMCNHKFLVSRITMEQLSNEYNQNKKWLKKSKMAAINISEGCNAECIFSAISVESKWQF